MNKLLITGLLFLCVVISHGQHIHSNEPCNFDQVTNNKNLVDISEHKIQSVLAFRNALNYKASSDTNRIIPVVVHVIHNGGIENISDAQIESQIQILNEDYGKLAGTNGDGNGVDTKIRFCLAKVDPYGNCTNGIVRINSSLTNHQSYQRALLKELSFWDNERYLNIYVVKTINGNVGGYSSFPGGPPEEDGFVVRHNLFGNIGTASSSLGRTATHELGHWLGLYHTFNNGCGTDVCNDGDYVCDTPPQSGPSYNCSTLNTCSNDNPDLNDQKENYMNYTPDACKSMFTDGQRLRIKAALDTIRTQIWQYSNLVSTGCDSNYIAPSTCPVSADFVTLNRDICVGNSVYFMDRSLNNPDTWNWTFIGGSPSSSSAQNPTIIYSTSGTYPVKLVASNSTSQDSTEILGYITVSVPGVGDALSFGENFDFGVYPPSNLSIVNNDGGITWELDSLASVSGEYSIKINNLINTNYGSSDELVLPYLDLTSSHPDSNVYMSFNWAYAKSDPTYSDELLVLLSTDCGVNYNQIFYKTQTALTTGPTQTTPFVPDSSQWKDAYISLNNYRNETYVQLKIVNVTDGGNNLYLDDIYVGDGSAAISGISENVDKLNDVTVYPNPAKDQITIQFLSNSITPVDIVISDINGKTVHKEVLIPTIGKVNEAYSISGINSGVYFVSIGSKNYSVTRKIVILP